MTNLFANLVLLAQRRHDDDTSGWFQLLIFIILGAIYALGGLLKLKAGKQKWLEEEEEEWQQGETPESARQEKVVPRYKPLYERLEIPEVPKPALGQQVRQPQAVQRAAHLRQYYKQQQAQKAQKKAATESPVREKKQFDKISQMDIKLKKLKKAAERETERKKVTKPAEVQIAAQSSVFNIDETDELRRAIIYSEILGKPIALR